MTSGISVVIASIPPRCRNGMLAEALASVAAQTLLPDAVHVAIDHDGDNEATTRNRALAAVTTPWVAFLDDDDLLRATHLRALMLHAEATGADLVYPWFDVEGGTDPLGAEGADFDAEAMRKGNFVPVTYLVRTELAQSVGGFPRELSDDWPHQKCVDWGFHLRLLDAGARYAHLPLRTWIWRHGSHRHSDGQPWVDWEPEARA